MRTLTLLLILSVAAATSAGCFGKDDEEPPANTTPTTGTAPTGATPTGATPTPGGGAANNTTAPTKPAAREVFSGNAAFDPQPPESPGAGTVRANAFTVPAQFTKLTLNVTWASSSPAPAPAPGGVALTPTSVTITDAAGTAIATCAGPAAGPVTVPAPCTMEGTIPAAGGEYSANYNGDAAGLSATVQVIAS